MGLKAIYVTKEQAANYLTDEAIASALVNSPNQSPIHYGLGGGIGTASTDWWSQFAPDASGEVHLLVEGVTAGTGRLTVEYLRNGTSVVSDSIYLSLKPIKNFYEDWTVGDFNPVGTLRESDAPAIAQTAQLTTDSSPVSDRDAFSKDYVLLVHGWRMKPAERRSFAETAYKRLYWQGFKGRFGLFNWPTEWTETDLTDFLNDPNARWNYDNSEYIAYRSAAGLRGVIKSLDAAGYSVNLLAHSMGNVVASEALRQEAMSNDSDKEIVHTYVASQAATTAAAYSPDVLLNDDADIFRYGLAAAGDFAVYRSATPDIYSSFSPTGRGYFQDIGLASERSYNFFNVHDGAVGDPAVWPLNQVLKPDDDVEQDFAYGYDPANGFYERHWHFDTSLGALVEDPRKWLNLAVPLDAYAAFAYAAEAKSTGLGATASVGGPFTVGGQVNLEDTQGVGFSANRYDHSGEFHHDNMETRVNWNLVMKRFGLAVWDRNLASAFGERP